MKNILLYILLLAAVMSYGQGFLKEEKAVGIKKVKKYDQIERGFSMKLARVWLNGKYGFINKATGEELIPPKYDMTYGLQEDLVGVMLKGKIGFVDTNGKEIVPPKYDGQPWFSEGLAAVKLNNKWGFINKIGEEVIPLKYDEVEDFSEGFAKVKLNGKVFYINKRGECVRDCNNTAADHPKKGFFSGLFQKE